MSDLTALAAVFRRFAELECGLSPMYRTLATAIAGDEPILDIARHGAGGPKPNLLLAAVHYLLLKDSAHPVARFYPTLGGSVSDSAELYPLFRSYVLEHAEAIRTLISTRRVQTNEVARAAALLPCFGEIARRAGRPLALVEVGTSAGLLLLFDQYAYDYGDGSVVGNPASPVRIACDVKGATRPPVPATMPSVAYRMGLDLNPIDLRDPDEALWLKALVWPDQNTRFERLQQAAELLVQAPPALLGGDALIALPSVLGDLPFGAAPVVFHCFALNQFPRDARDRFYAIVAEQSQGRTMYVLGYEYYHYGEELPPELRLRVYADGALTEQITLARAHGHGAWIEWL